jgi:hypothetical protein
MILRIHCLRVLARNGGDGRIEEFVVLFLFTNWCILSDGAINSRGSRELE